MAGSVSEAVADVQEAVAEQVAEAQEAALENSAAQIAVAERAAQAANDALLMTELGRRVATVEGRLEECLSQNSSLRMEVQALAAQAQPAVPAVMVDNSSTQAPRLPQNAAPLPEGIDPASQEAAPEPEGAGGGGPEKTASRPKRRLL